MTQGVQVTEIQKDGPSNPGRLTDVLRGGVGVELASSLLSTGRVGARGLPRRGRFGRGDPHLAGGRRLWCGDRSLRCASGRVYLARLIEETLKPSEQSACEPRPAA